MIAIDCESTGLFMRNGCTTFSIGQTDGTSFFHSTVGIDPRTRKRVKEHPRNLRKAFDNADVLVFHNAKFDLACLCEAGIYDWQEPNEASFWKRIVDTTTLAHLHCSTDELALDVLTQKYLGKGYPEDKELINVVNKCRRLVETKALKDICGNWDIARREGKHPTFKMYGSSGKWNRSDFWLPAAVLEFIPQSRRPKLPDSVLKNVMLRYLKADCVNTFELAEMYFHELLSRHAEQTTELLEINKQVEHITWKMETVGLWVNIPELKESIDACERFIQLLTAETSKLSGIDHITDHNLREYLFGKLKLEPISKSTKTGTPSVDAKTILALHEDAEVGSPVHRFLGAYLSKKKYEKKLTSLQSYYHARSSSGFIHPSFNIVGTKTTRFSSNNPNAQNITKAGNPYEDDAPDIAKWLQASPSMRSVFGPAPKRWFIDCDYSQLQLRIFAYLSKEQPLIDALEEGQDFHDFVARKLFSVPDNDKPSKAQRRIAKNCVFGILFGASEKKIDATSGTTGMYRLLLSLFPNAHAFIEQTKYSIEDIGFVETLGGYPLALKEHVNKWTGRIEKAAHAGVNYIVQGAEGVIVKRAMRLCDDYLTSEYPEGRIVLQVHDELLFELPEKPPKQHVLALKQRMEQAAEHYGIKAPVDAEVCFRNWDRSVKVKLR